MKNISVKNNKGKVLKGKIVSAKMKDTVVVSIDNFKKHPKISRTAGMARNHEL